MLVLSRKKGEIIVIGDQIEVSVISVEGENVKLGIKAPKSVEIYRKEVYLALQQSNREASQNTIKLSELKSKLLNKKGSPSE